MEKIGERPLLPPNPAPYLIGWLLEIGPDVPTGMGEAPIGFRDIAAWSEVAGIDLMPWEASLLRSLSKAWVSERGKAVKRDAPAPYTGTRPEIVSGRDLVARKVKAAFGGLKGKRG